MNFTTNLTNLLLESQCWTSPGSQLPPFAIPHTYPDHLHITSSSICIDGYMHFPTFYFSTRHISVHTHFHLTPSHLVYPQGYTRKFRHRLSRSPLPVPCPGADGPSYCSGKRRIRSAHFYVQCRGSVAVIRKTITNLFPKYRMSGRLSGICIR